MAGGGKGPERLNFNYSTPFITAGRLFRVAGSPEYVLPAYVVFPRTADNPVLEQAPQGLRELAGLERERAARR